MHQTSALYQEILRNPAHEKEIKLDIAGVEYLQERDEIISVSTSGGIFSRPDIGGCTSRQIDLEVYPQGDIPRQAKIQVFVRLKFGTQVSEWIPKHQHRSIPLQPLPGFCTYYGEWTLSGPKGFLIPVRNRDGLIQGLKIRLDDADKPDRKYRWLSSRGLPDGTRSYSWVHVTGNTASKRAFITEGPLKGDAASFLANDALFVCVGGVNAIHGLKDTLVDLGVREVVEAMDMDQMTNENVRKAVLEMRREVQSIPGIRYSKYTWNPAYKGVDDYLLSRRAAQM